MSDWCTWDEDYNIGIVEVIRKELVELSSSRPEEYTAVLMQGSGSFCVEATLGSVIKADDHLLVAANGAYGKRMGVIADYYHLNCHVMRFEETQPVDPKQIDEYLTCHPETTHVSVVHCETTTGVLNPLADIAAVVKKHGKTLIVDAMSSFGGVPVDMAALGIDFMISSANKCIQGVPGFGFIIVRRSMLEGCKGVARSLSLDLYDQWQTLYDRMEAIIRSNQLGSEYEAALNNRIALGILGLGLNITVSTQSMGKKVKDIHRIIRQERYRKAYKNLPLNYFPIHWKLFYGCARHGFAFGVYVLLTVIQRIISR